MDVLLQNGDFPASHVSFRGGVNDFGMIELSCEFWWSKNFSSFCDGVKAPRWRQE